MKRRRFLTVMSAAPALPQQTLPPSRDAAGSPCPQKTDKGGMTGVMPIIIIPEWGADSEAKNSQGHAMFPFRGRSCPTDWNTETRRLAREAGLTFFVYYSIGMDNLTAEQHPEWACIDGAGKPIKSYGFEGNTFYWLCFRTPWRDVVIDEIRQVTEALRPEGLWLDQAGAPNSYGGRLDPESACHCRYCRAAYLERNGKEMPATSEDPAVRLAIYRLAEDARVEMLRDIIRAARKIVPDIALSYNFAGAFWERLQVHPDLAEVECAVTRNSIEAKAHTDLSMNAKMLASAGKAFELTSYGHLQTLRPGTGRLEPASFLLSRGKCGRYGGTWRPFHDRHQSPPGRNAVRGRVPERFLRVFRGEGARAVADGSPQCAEHRDPLRLSLRTCGPLGPPGNRHDFRGAGTPRCASGGRSSFQHRTDEQLCSSGIPGLPGGQRDRTPARTARTVPRIRLRGRTPDRH
jgi:hypothetical protein